MKKTYLIGFIFGSLFISCNEKKEMEAVETKSSNVSDITSASYFMEKLLDLHLIDSLDNLALNKGDTSAYNELKKIHYIGQQRSTGFLYYALIMSNKFNYKKASYDVYDILIRDSLDDKTREMANKYLIQSK